MAVAQTMDEVTADLTRRSGAALIARRESGETFFYLERGWVYRERAGGEVERLCPLETFRAADYPEDYLPV